jgi:5-methylcytosine-specific restriction endonuclease McrA
MKRPKVHKSKARIVTGPKKAGTVSKIRRTKEQAYGDRWTWTTICAEVKRRAGYKCQKCSRPESDLGLQVDHIVEVARGGATAFYNLRALCPICHANRPSHKAAKKLILHEANNREKRRVSKGHS